MTGPRLGWGAEPVEPWLIARGCVAMASGCGLRAPGVWPSQTDSLHVGWLAAGGWSIAKVILAAPSASSSLPALANLGTLFCFRSLPTGPHLSTRASTRTRTRSHPHPHAPSHGRLHRLIPSTACLHPTPPTVFCMYACTFLSISDSSRSY